MILGIIGGMGPAAGYDLAQKIVTATSAQSDANHLPVLVASIPTIPDRTEALVFEGPDFVPAVVQVGQNLIKAGATHLMIACNTAHARLDQIRSRLSVPILSMPEFVMQQVASLGLERIVLFASNGTLLANVYDQAAKQNKIKIIKPTRAEQIIINEAIYLVKAGNLNQAKEQLTPVIIKYEEISILLACTELPLVLSEFELPNVLDATRLFAEKLIHNLSLNPLLAFGFCSCYDTNRRRIALFH